MHPLDIEAIAKAKATRQGQDIVQVKAVRAMSMDNEAKVLSGAFVRNHAVTSRSAQPVAKHVLPSGDGTARMRASLQS
jgi:hypothetical protein